MTGVDIRLVRPDEWEAFRDLRLRALRDAPDAFGGTADASIDRDETYWRGWIEGEGWDGDVRSWVADDRGRLRGMAVGARFDEDPATMNLFGMWVEPELRGSGIATRLVGMVERWGEALGVERIVLRVTQGNARAERYYEKLGYRRTDRDPIPLRDGSAVLTREMARSLALRSASAEPVGDA